MEYRRGWRAFIRSTESRSLRNIDRQVLGRIWSYARPYKGQMALILLAVVLQALIGVVPPLFYRYFIDHILPNKDLSQLWLFAGLLLALPFATVCIGLVQQTFSMRLGETLVYDLRKAMFDHVHKLSMRFFTHTREGEVIARFTQDVEGARRMVTNTIPETTTAIITLLTTLIVMGQLEWRLTVPGVLLFPLFWPFAYWLARILRRTYHQGLEYNASLTSMVGETLNVNGALLMKLFGQQQAARERFDTLSELVRQFRIRWSILSYWLTSGMGIMSGVGIALFYGLGGYLVIHGEVTVGTIVALVAYLPRVFRPITSISHVSVDVIQGVASYERVFAYIDIPSEIVEAPDAEELKTAEGHIEFTGVSFDYAQTPNYIGVSDADSESAIYRERQFPGIGDTARPALEDVSFKVDPGEMVALVGLSGAGKTTIINLVMRIYDPTSGRVCLEGRDIRHLTFNSLSAHIGVVTQDAYLFYDTLRANVLYAKPTASERELLEVCKAAHLEEFIAGLPNGLDTLVGERGHRLSGGEKQRVSIARAILKKPSILLLDEATSHLDAQSEQAIQRALGPLLADCTSLVIAHRLSTVRNADRILVLDEGRIAEAGTHAELIKVKGLYSHLYALQYQARRRPSAVSPQLD